MTYKEICLSICKGEGLRMMILSLAAVSANCADPAAMVWHFGHMFLKHSMTLVVIVRSLGETTVPSYMQRRRYRM